MANVDVGEAVPNTLEKLYVLKVLAFLQTLWFNFMPA